MVSSLNPTEVQNTLLQNGMSNETTLGVISNLVDKEAMTMSVDHVFLILTLVFVVASLIIWLAPKPKIKVTGPSH